MDVIGVRIFNSLGGKCNKETLVLHVNWNRGSQFLGVLETRIYCG